MAIWPAPSDDTVVQAGPASPAVQLFRRLRSCLLIFLLCLAQASNAQTSLSGGKNDGYSGISDKDLKFGLSSGSFIAVPIPSHNPAFDSTLALVGAYLFKDDEKSDNSYVGVGGFGSGSGSSGYGGTASLALDENRWKIATAVGDADLFYDLFVEDSHIPIRQDVLLASGQFSYGIRPDTSFGLGVRYLESAVAAETSRRLPDAVRRFSSTRITSVGLLGQWDRRDDTFYPTDGENLTADAYQNYFDSGLDPYQKAVLKLDGYRTIGGNGVAAIRVAGCLASANAPFFDACSLGGTDGFRGFQVTENIGDGLVSGQMAWRQRFGPSGRFGYELFAGAGRVSNALLSSRSEQTRLAAGAGVRYRLTEQFPLDLALDLSVNDENEANVYVRIGQSFGD